MLRGLWVKTMQVGSEFTGASSDACAACAAGASGATCIVVWRWLAQHVIRLRYKLSNPLHCPSEAGSLHDANRIGIKSCRGHLVEGVRTCSSGFSGAASASGAAYKMQCLQAFEKQVNTARLTN